MTLKEITNRINQLLARANTRQLTLIHRIVQAILN